jgi:hypothetical protein
MREYRAWLDGGDENAARMKEWSARIDENARG